MEERYQHFFTQECVICTHCLKMYALGEFEGRDYELLKLQNYLAPERSTRFENYFYQGTTEIQRMCRTFFLRYPHIKELHNTNWRDTAITRYDYHRQLYQIIQEGTFTQSELLVLEYLRSSRFTQEEIEKETSPEFRISCKACGKGELLVDFSSLSEPYQEVMRSLPIRWEVVYDRSPPNLIKVLLYSSAIQLGVMFTLWLIRANFYYSLLSLALLIVIDGSILSERNPLQAENRELQVMEGIFKTPDFEWYKNRWSPVPATLVIGNPEVWKWVEEEKKAFEYKSESKFSATYRIEFLGVILKHTSDFYTEHCLMEVVEMRSVRFVKCSGGKRKQEDLLRPSHAPDPPNEELLRPQSKEPDPDDELLHPSEEPPA